MPDASATAPAMTRLLMPDFTAFPYDRLLLTRRKS
jgi:hypothetical protein